MYSSIIGSTRCLYRLCTYWWCVGQRGIRL